ncbi:unnamed protein product [Dibothriocephalus latus]|uniref:Uncharacterized protein n=1 Tax=Dibothriocephalus latus TaxID=60516 RepID=A0A3P7NVR3_DIBLA|nr:unnamed protein product [Dibothriocephalus latus]
MMSIRSTFKEDIGCTAADLIFETSLRLSGELGSPSNTLTSFNPSGNVDLLYSAMRNRSATPPRASPTNSFVCPDLDKCRFVLVGRDAVRRPFHILYGGPYKVVRPYDKDFVIHHNG